LGELLSVDQLGWNLLANLTQPLFEGGRLRANVRASEAVVREQAATYAQTILNAMREVENALQAEQNTRQQLNELEKTAEEADAAYDLALTRYTRGLVDLSQILDIERRLFAYRQQIIEVRQQIWQARLALHLSLGGPWLENATYTDTAAITLPTVPPTEIEDFAASVPVLPIQTEEKLQTNAPANIIPVQVEEETPVSDIIITTPTDPPARVSSYLYSAGKGRTDQPARTTPTESRL
jgi:hypothetical protein